MVKLTVRSALSGDVLITCEADLQGCSINDEAFRLALVYVAARKLYLPSGWVSIRMVDSESDTLTMEAVVTCPDWDDLPDTDSGCALCGDTREAAGDACEWYGDGTGCYCCLPDFLCGRCRVRVLDGYKCLACLEKEEHNFLSGQKRNRLDALKQWWSILDIQCVGVPSGHVR